MRYQSLYAALPLILSLLITGCAGLEQRKEPPRVNLVNLRILDVQLFEQRYGLTLRIINPDRRELSIEGFSFEVELNGQEFAYGVSGEQVVIPGFSEETLEVEVIGTRSMWSNNCATWSSARANPLNTGFTAGSASPGD